MYFTDRSKDCKENTMQHYGPFDKPYGFFTWSGAKERFKGLIVLLSSLITIMLATACVVLAEEAPNIFLKFFVYIVMGAPSFAMAAASMLLGTTWIYFPEWKPELRKRLTW